MAEKTTDELINEMIASAHNMIKQSAAASEVSAAAKPLGALRAALIAEGFSSDEAFALVYETLTSSLPKPR